MKFTIVLLALLTICKINATLENNNQNEYFYDLKFLDLEENTNVPNIIALKDKISKNLLHVCSCEREENSSIQDCKKNIDTVAILTEDEELVAIDAKYFASSDVSEPKCSEDDDIIYLESDYLGISLSGDLINLSTNEKFPKTTFCIYQTSKRNGSMNWHIKTCLPKLSLNVPSCCPFGSYYDIDSMSCIVDNNVLSNMPPIILNTTNDIIISYKQSTLTNLITCDETQDSVVIPIGTSDEENSLLYDSDSVSLIS